MAKRVPVLRGESSPHYESPDLTVTLDAAALANRIGKAVAEHHREAISRGQKASGGPQRPLGPREAAKAARGKRHDERGMGIKGALPDSVEHTTGRGDLRATFEVAPGAVFGPWLERESARRVEYFYADGDVEDILDAVISDDLKRQGFQ